MKKIISFFAILMMVMAIPQSVKAYDFSYTYQGKTLYYNIVNGEAQVTRQNNGSPAYTNLSGTLVIPNTVTYNGTTYPVTSIGDGAFYECSGLTSVTIPNSVTSIDYYAFYFCSGLTSVTIGNSVTYIGDFAFTYCSGLTSVTIPNSVTYIGDEAFYFCSGLTEVTMLSEIAPTLGSSVFSRNGSSRIINIPCGSYDSYYNGSGWFDYRAALHEKFMEYALTIGSSDSVKGIANGGDVACDSSAIIRATPSYGYHFDHWSNGNTANPDTLHLVGDSTVTAIFAPNQYELAVQSADESLGSADGSGTYDYLDTVEISASGINHHHFVHWSDGNRDNPRQVVVTGDMIFSAYFAIDTHTVNVVTSDIARGMVETTGTEFAYGTPCTVTATAYTGYIFAGWSNGVTANPYTFAVLSDVELTALFVAEGEDVYTVTVESADPTMGTVSGGGQALGGGTVTIRAAGNPGYHFTQWNDGNTDSVRTVEVHGNVTYTAYFEADNAGIDDADAINEKVYYNNGVIVVEGANGNIVTLYDVTGRMLISKQDVHTPLRFDVPASGTYMIKIGNYPARKIVVIR